MSQPARFLHPMTPFAARQLTACDVDEVGDHQEGALLAAQAGLIVALTALIVSSGEWMAVTVRAIAWMLRI
jgi:hypothetical protein